MNRFRDTGSGTMHERIVCVICLVSLIAHLFYISISRQYPQWDEHNYLGLAIKYTDIVRTHSPSMIFELTHVSGSLQPVYSALIAGIIGIAGTAHTYAWALGINGILFSLTIYGVYMLAKLMFDPLTGLAASIVFAGLGNALFYSHFSYAETAVTAGIIWTLVYIYKSRNFTDTKFSVYAGLLCAIAVLTRWIAPVFIAGPAVVAVVTGILKNMGTVRSKNNFFKNTALFLLLGAGLPILLYFIPNYDVFVSYVMRNQTDAVTWVKTYRDADMTDTFSTRSVMYYFNILSQNTVYIFILFLIGITAGLIKPKKSVFIFSAFVVPYAFLTFVAVWKEDRFLVPIYPAFAIIAASGVSVYATRRSKFIMISLLAGISMLTYMAAVWGTGPLGYKGLADYVLPAFIHHPRRIYLTPLIWKPTRELVNAHSIAAEIRTHSGNKTNPTVIPAYDFEPLDNAFLSITGYHDRTLMKYRKLTPAEATDAEDILEKAPEYVLIKSNDSIRIVFTRSAAFRNYSKIAIIPVPMDNSTVTVYAYEKK